MPLHSILHYHQHYCDSRPESSIKKKKVIQEHNIRENPIHSLLEQLSFVQVIKGLHNTLLFEEVRCFNLCTMAKFSIFSLKEKMIFLWCDGRNSED